VLPSLSAPGTATSVDVPILPAALNMEQKYRLDAWGVNLFYYANRTADFSVTIGASTLTYNAANPFPDIDGFTVNGKSAVGVIISKGPNGILDSTITAGTPVVVTTGGDDIVVPIEVSQEAIEVALDDLKILQAKVKAFDALYEGIDNGGATTNPDDNICVAAAPPGSACPPFSGLTNDPNCGTATLDAIFTNPVANYNCAGSYGGAAGDRTGALRVIIGYYSLSLANYFDPWGRMYEWGEGTSGVTTAPPTGGTTITSGTSWYHKLYSQGPSTTTNTDDIIP
ncbi:MAG: hypothetical protein V1742_09785, partial [Pseudomonadota bacterium]